MPVIFGSVAFLWGIPYALIKVALDHGAGPLLIAWTRVAISAAVLLAVQRHFVILRCGGDGRCAATAR